MKPGDAALKAAGEYGWHVFPCRPDKSPYTSNGLLDATVDTGQLARWWRRWPGALVGLACGKSGLVVIDADVPKAGQTIPRPWCEIPGVTDGADILAAYVEDHGAGKTLWNTRTVRTRRGGWHWYWRDPAGMSPGVGEKSWLGLPLVDVRAGGAYVIAFGSGYRTTHPGPVAAAPGWLLEKWREHQNRVRPALRIVTLSNDKNAAYAQTALNAECAKVAEAARGERNDVLFRAAFSLSRLVENGELSERDFRDGLVMAASVAGLAEREATTAIDSAMKRRTSRGRPA